MKTLAAKMTGDYVIKTPPMFEEGTVKLNLYKEKGFYKNRVGGITVKVPPQICGDKDSVMDLQCKLQGGMWTIFFTTQKTKPFRGMFAIPGLAIKDFSEGTEILYANKDGQKGLYFLQAPYGPKIPRP